MSWAAHELEAYVIQRKGGTRVSFLAVMLGSLAPDLFTKLPVYGLKIGDFEIRAGNPAQYHRGWPGAGMTTSLMFGVAAFALALVVFKRRGWALGLLIGITAHVLTDTFDSVGSMIFFPFTTQLYSVGMWGYAGQEGRYGDAIAYYSSLGGAWDLLWLVIGLLSWRVLTREYFHTVVEPADPAWAWIRRRFALSERALVALYRSYFFYGACRIFGWGLWAHLREGSPFDLSWGGPDFITPVDLSHASAATMAVNTVVGITGFALTCWVLWRFWLRRHWDAAVDAPARAGPPGLSG
jgi:membrane-bound metal-dependent hydrolase YbcI (DUF457 family)